MLLCRYVGLVARPMPGFAFGETFGFRPGGRPTSLGAQRSRQENRPEETAHPLGGCPVLLEQRGPRPTRVATLCSDSDAESALDACCARASLFCAARRFLRGSAKTAEQPTAKPFSRSPRGIPLTPLSPAEQRNVLRPRAKLASSTDSAPLFEQSVAARVGCGASRPEQRRAPAAQRRAGRSGGALCLLSGGTESRSPAGAKTEGFAEGKSPHGPGHQQPDGRPS